MSSCIADIMKSIKMLYMLYFFFIIINKKNCRQWQKLYWDYFAIRTVSSFVHI